MGELSATHLALRDLHRQWVGSEPYTTGRYFAVEGVDPEAVRTRLAVTALGDLLWTPDQEFVPQELNSHLPNTDAAIRTPYTGVSVSTWGVNGPEAGDWNGRAAVTFWHGRLGEALAVSVQSHHPAPPRAHSFVADEGEQLDDGRTYYSRRERPITDEEEALAFVGFLRNLRASSAV